MTNKEAIKYLIVPFATSTKSYNEYLKQKEAYDLAIKALEVSETNQDLTKSNQGDLISRSALKKAMWEESHSIATFTEFGTEEAHIGLTVNEIEHIIEKAPTVEPTFGLFKEMLCAECGKRPQVKVFVDGEQIY